jgi:hypothetical protein
MSMESMMSIDQLEAAIAVETDPEIAAVMIEQHNALLASRDAEPDEG